MSIYAYPGWDCVDEPELADRWMYQAHDGWMAVAPWESEADWFANCDEDRTWTPRRRVLPIDETPPFGTLTYVIRQGDGCFEPREQVTDHPPKGGTHPPYAVVMTVRLLVTPSHESLVPAVNQVTGAGPALGYLTRVNSMPVLNEASEATIEVEDIDYLVLDPDGEEVTSW